MVHENKLFKHINEKIFRIKLFIIFFIYFLIGIFIYKDFGLVLKNIFRENQDFTG